MKPEEFYEKMVELKQKYKNDEEIVHFEMDNLMLALLKELGYKKGVEVFEDTKMWYS